MNNNKNSSFSPIKKSDKKNNLFKIFKYKTDRNSQEKVELKYNNNIIVKQNPNNINSPKSKHTSNPKKTKNIPLYTYKDTLKNAYKKLSKNLRKYNFFQKKYNKQKINEIIFDKRKRLVSVFKDYLLWNETSDFLKEYHHISDSISLIPNMCEYYENYTLLFPEYGPLEDVLKFMRKNMKKKKVLLEKYEDNNNKRESILQNEGENSSLKAMKIDNDKETNNEPFHKIISEKDMELDLSKTYSHSKTCLNNEYFQVNENEKKLINEKNLSSIISDFLNIDEKVIENYKYLNSKNSNITNDKEEKKVEKYFKLFDRDLKKENIHLKNDNKKIENIELQKIKENNRKNKDDNVDINLQKLKLKNIFKIIKSSNNLKKININYENLTINKSSNKQSLNKNRSKKNINKKNSVKNKQSVNSKKTISKNKTNNSKSDKKKNNAISTNYISLRKKVNNPMSSRPYNIKQIKNHKFIKKDNNFSMSNNLNKLFITRTKNSESNSNHPSKNKQPHRYKLLINNIFDNLQNKQKILNNNDKLRNYSDGQKFNNKKDKNIKSKNKSKRENIFKRKKIDLNIVNQNHINNDTYNNHLKYNQNMNNLMSSTSINKTSSEKTNSRKNKKVNIKNMNIKINPLKTKKLNSLNYINIFKKAKNPFMLYSKEKINRQSSNKNKFKTTNPNEYLSFSLTNRMNKNKIDKSKLNLIIAKTIENENNQYINKNLVSFKKIKNQNCITSNNNKINIKKINIIDRKMLRNNLRENLKNNSNNIDNYISRNEEFFKKNKINNTLKLNLNNIDKSNIRNLNNKKGITSREKNKTKIHSKKNKNENLISNLRKKEIINRKKFSKKK